GFGLPMSVLLVRPQWDQWQPGQHNGTFRGNGHAFVTARAALLKFWSDDTFTDAVARRSALVSRLLTDLAGQVPGARLKGRGMMQGIDVGPRLSAEITRGCARNGLIIESAGPRDEVIKVFAPLTTPDGQLEQGLRILADTALAAAGGSGSAVPG
ncbi:MAG: diaminobutyrate-2-oxoglutarate transaminase, partial [Pseudonocardiales bacterium]|nr:diaminobutyrate-2-oxoglutarate transaminase [Pseudonocardiales bacterium]